MMCGILCLRSYCSVVPYKRSSVIWTCVCITADILKLSRASFPVFTLSQVKLVGKTALPTDDDSNVVVTWARCGDDWRREYGSSSNVWRSILRSGDALNWSTCCRSCRVEQRIAARTHRRHQCLLLNQLHTASAPAIMFNYQETGGSLYIHIHLYSP